jgi:hypothetical protein
MRPPRPPIDYADWFRGPLRSFVAERLLDARSPLAGLTRPAAVERLLHEHQTRRTNHTVRIGCLLTFDAWKRSMEPTPPRVERRLIAIRG